MEEYILIERPLSVEEYLRLREAIGWWYVDSEALKICLPNSLFSFCVIHNDEVIGCGRVVGDGGMYFYIQDIIVLPEFQGKGIGRRIMDAVMDFITFHPHTGAFVALMAAKGVSKFYEKYGFQERPLDRPGMFRIWERE